VKIDFSQEIKKSTPYEHELIKHESSPTDQQRRLNLVEDGVDKWETRVCSDLCEIDLLQIFFREVVESINDLHVLDLS
jgi:hypothetical protein